MIVEENERHKTSAGQSPTLSGSTNVVRSQESSDAASDSNGYGDLAGFGVVTDPLVFWAMAYKVSDVIMLLEQLGVLSLIAAKPMPIEAIVAETGLQADPLRSMLTMLLKLAIVDKTADRYHLPANYYRLTPVVSHERDVRYWHGNNQSLLKQLKNSAGEDPMESADATTDGSYYQAMASAVRNVGLHLLRFLRLNNPRKIVDLGGGDGALARVLSSYLSNCSFHVVDRAQVERCFIVENTAADNNEVAADITFYGIDLRTLDGLAPVLRDADVVVLSNVLHMLKAEEQNHLLRFIHNKLSAGARVVVYDQFVAEGTTGIGVPELMVIDWLNCGKNFDYTAPEFCAELDNIGYHSVTCKNYPSIPGAFVSAEK